jgi:signal transduction histidine kinase
VVSLPALWKRSQPDHVLLMHDRLIWDQLHLDCSLRFAVVGIILVGSLSARYLVGIRELDVWALVACALVVLAHNLLTLRVIRPYRSSTDTERAQRFLTIVRHVTIGVDFLVLTVLVYLVGGARSPFLAAFLLHVVMSSLLGSRRAAVVHALLAYLMLGGLIACEWVGWLEPHLPFGAVSDPGPIDGRHALGLVVVYGFLLVTTSLLVTGLARKLRLGELRLWETNLELERLSRSRRDFLHVALHNLQAPVSAATMMLENLETGGRGSLNDDQLRWVQRILERIRGSSEFLRDLQMLAALEGEALLESARPVDMGAIARAAVEDTRDLREARGQKLRLEIAEGLPALEGVERLLREAVVNYLTNAIKYTPPGGHVVVRVESHDGQVELAVKDDGIGIAAVDQAGLFHEFVRVRHNPEVARVPGTGLGLSITRRIIEAHGGTVSVESEEGRGSTFGFGLPAASESASGARALAGSMASSAAGAPAFGAAGSEPSRTGVSAPPRPGAAGLNSAKEPAESAKETPR